MHKSHDEGCLLKWEVAVSIAAYMADDGPAMESECGEEAFLPDSGDESLDEKTVGNEDLMRLREINALVIDRADIEKGLGYPKEWRRRGCGIQTE